MTDKVIKTISEHHMISSGDTVGVGLSGGADSVVLFHILVSNKEKLGISKIKGIHIHHGIRGEEADRDLNFSKELCERFGIEFISFYADVPREAEKTGESIEECARRLRYAFFSKSGCTKIATAHNLNDNMETVIFNMTRGASVSGLCGIPYVREKYIRPLLDCSRSEIENYLSEKSLDYVTDSTNLCDDYTRNKIRHNILPQLFEINPSFDKAFVNCIDSVKLANDYVLNSAKEMLEKSRIEDGYDCTVFEDCHNAVKNQIVSLILKEQNVKNITKKYIDAVIHISKNGGTANLGGNITANVQQKKLYFGDFEDVDFFSFQVENQNCTVKTPVGTVNIEFLFKKDLQNLNKENMDFFIDCDKILGELSVRNRTQGDCYCPAGRVNKKLKKLFNEEKISVNERSKMIILSDECGIVWTEYFGVANRCRVKNNTEKCIKISVVGE